MGSYGGDNEQGSREIREPLLTEAGKDPQVPSLPERDRRRESALRGAKQVGHRPLSAEAADVPSMESDGYVVSSYLSVLAMLMDREEDVHELRAKGVICSHFSNKQTLAFFKGIGQHLRLGNNYFTIVQEIEDYRRKRPIRIVVYKFIYKNYRVIFALMSIASVLVGIFKALYALKKP